MKLWNRMISALFPKPRRPIHWSDAVSLMLFLVAFVATCVYLDRSHTVLFIRPWALTVAVVSPWVWWMSVAGYAGLSRARTQAALVVRLALVALFAIALAEPRAVRTADVMSVVFAVDVSDSIGNTATDEALKFISRIATTKPKLDEAGLVPFGKSAGVELPPSQAFQFEAINTQVDRDATNIEQALSLSAAMLKEQYQGRIVLISDGVPTEGSLSRILDDLKARKIAVDVLPIQYNYDQEVWAERLDLPQFVKLGETYEASIVVSSLQDGKGTLSLQENGQEFFRQENVEFKAGKNRFTVPISLRQPGYYEYTAVVEVPGNADRLSANNKVVNSLFVEGEGKVLMVIDPQGDPRDSGKLTQALREGKRVVETRSADDMPREAASLLPYDCIIFCNVAADAFDVLQLQAVHESVRNFGVGFLMVGGANSFGPGGFHRTVIEEALPVTMDITQKKVLPKGALVIILHTCEFADGNTWAKRITKQAIKVLGAQDEVGVIDYEGGAQWVFELSPAGDYDKMVTKINGAEPGDMPSFADTMQTGLEGLKKSDASARHMIIISDGDPQPPPPQLLKQFIESQITVSMVAIFPHGGQEISTMRAVANATGGRYYFPADANELPRIFIKESKTLKRSMIQTRTFFPEVHMSAPLLKGVDAMPELKGFVLTSAKPSAEVILKTPFDPKTGEEGDIDPLLATWRYGIGSSAAWTSDLSPNWAGEWMSWEHYQAFVTQLVTSIARVRKEGHLRMQTYTQGNEAVIVVEDFHPQESFLEVTARISGPKERVETLPLKQVAPRRYQASVPLWGTGRYHVMAAGAGDGKTREEYAHGGVIVPYSPEYLRFRSNPIALKEIAERTGGQLLTSKTEAEEIYNRDRQPKQSSRPIFDWFLIALACLVPLDVGIRRVQIDAYAIRSLFTFGKKRGPTTATMSALLERKQSVAATMQRRGGDSTLPAELAGGTTAPRRPTVPGTPGTSPGGQATAPDAAPEPSAAPAPDTNTTTGRLLELKRRRKTD